MVRASSIASHDAPTRRTSRRASSGHYVKKASTPARVPRRSGKSSRPPTSPAKTPAPPPRVGCRGAARVDLQDFHVTHDETSAYLRERKLGLNKRIFDVCHGLAAPLLVGHSRHVEFHRDLNRRRIN